jgi:hypothetical protein
MSKLLDRAVAAARIAADPDKLTRLEQDLADRTRERDQARRFAELAQRHKLEYFDLVVRLERQRDEWVEIARSSAQQYHAGLAMVEHQLGRERIGLKSAVDELNRIRVESGKPAFKHIEELPNFADPPSGEAKRYAEAMFDLFKGGDPGAIRERVKRGEKSDRPADINAVAEREALQGKQAKERP